MCTSVAGGLPRRVAELVLPKASHSILSGSILTALNYIQLSLYRKAFTDMKEKYNRLSGRYNDLSGQYNELKEKYSDIREKYDNAENRHSKLFTVHASLQRAQGNMEMQVSTF